MIFFNAKADKTYVDGLEGRIKTLEAMKTTLSDLIAAEEKFKKNGDISGFKNTSFDKFENQSIMNALSDANPNDMGVIADYVKKAVQTGTANQMIAINTFVSTQTGGAIPSLELFVGKVYKELYAENTGIIARLTQLEEYSSAIDNFVKNSNGTYADYADVLAEIENARSTLDGLKLPAGKTFDTAVTDIISRELGKTDSELKKLEAKLQKEIDALKGMIQSLVYVPEYADGEVRFTTLFVDKDYTNGNSSNLSDWTPVVSMNEVKMKFRVSPKSAVAELVKTDGSGKYIITTDAQELKTRAANVFSVTKVAAVANEPNLIEVTLNAGTAAQSYAVALTVSGKDNTTEFTDITSNYFAVIKQNRYIKKVTYQSFASGAQLDGITLVRDLS